MLYAFGIACFMEFVLIQTEFDWLIVKFYSIGLVAMFIIIELFGTFLFLRIVKNKYEKLSQKNKKLLKSHWQ